MNSPDMPGNLEYPIYLGLGSNSGDREYNIRDALRRLDMAFGRHYEALSDIIETKPWGFESEDMFLNAAVRYRLAVPRGTSGMQIKDNERRAAYGILSICKDIETSMGRIQRVEYGNDGKRVYRSRPIDIDILLFGDIAIRERDEDPLHRINIKACGWVGKKGTNEKKRYIEAYYPLFERKNTNHNSIQPMQSLSLLRSIFSMSYNRQINIRSQYNQSIPNKKYITENVSEYNLFL